MINSNDISNALMRIGVEAGDVCLFHSSYKSLGPVDGGAQSVVDGFENVLTDSGTLVVPTLCSKNFFDCYNTWHIDKPSEVGYLTEYVRNLPGTLRSDHATHSVAARGKLAYELTFEHTAFGAHLCPFGEYAFADSSPWMKMYKLDAKIVFVGVTMKYNTMKHLIEATVTETLLSCISDDEKRKKQMSCLESFDNRWSGVWLYYNAESMQRYLESLGLVRKTVCGNATLLCVEAKKSSDIAVKTLIEEPEKWYDNDRLDWIYECKKR